MWCPECGAEYKPIVAQCGDCLVALVDQAPVDDTDHSLSEWELVDFDEEELRSLFQMLRGAHIVFDWNSVPNTLRAAREHEAAVDEFLEWFEDGAEDAPDLELPAVVDRRRDEEDPLPLAGYGRRIGGYVVDGVISSAVLGFVWWTLGRPGGLPASIASTTLVIGYETFAVAMWGRTLGKAIVGTRVVAAGTMKAPSLGQALRRSLVTTLPPYAGALSRWITPVIFVPVLFDPRRRGLHDRFAGTVVIYDPR